MGQLDKSHGDILARLPGLVCCLDADNHLIFANEFTSSILGFKKSTDAIGVSIKNLPCRVAEYADIFASQNAEVRKLNREIKLLDIHPFANEEIIAFLTTKSCFDYGSARSGVLVLGTQVTRSMLLSVNIAIIQTDKQFRNNKSSKQRSYQFINDFHSIKLSTREMECLFYLVRGKTVADISAILHLSKRTIESYIENIKFKMGCHSKAELIERALENNFIDFIPESLLSSKPDHISLILDQ